MAGARKVELDCDGSFAEAAAAVVGTRAEEVFERASGVLDLGEVEGVHDMRVATRRLRAALEVFAPAFPRKRHGKALKKVKRLADALGARRDADVEVEMLEALPTEAGAEALGDLLVAARRRQRQANRELEAYVVPKRLRKLRKRLRKLAKEAAR